MTPEAEKLLREILNSIIESCYSTMGQEWCEEMWEKVEQLRHVGKL